MHRQTIAIKALLLPVISCLKVVTVVADLVLGGSDFHI